MNNAGRLLYSCVLHASTNSQTLLLDFKRTSTFFIYEQLEIKIQQPTQRPYPPDRHWYIHAACSLYTQTNFSLILHNGNRSRSELHNSKLPILTQIYRSLFSMFLCTFFVRNLYFMIDLEKKRTKCGFVDEIKKKKKN